MASAGHGWHCFGGAVARAVAKLGVPGGPISRAMHSSWATWSSLGSILCNIIGVV